MTLRNTGLDPDFVLVPLELADVEGRESRDAVGPHRRYHVGVVDLFPGEPRTDSRCRRVAETATGPLYMGCTSPPLDTPLGLGLGLSPIATTKTALLGEERLQQRPESRDILRRRLPDRFEVEPEVLVGGDVAHSAHLAPWDGGSLRLHVL